MNSGKSRRECQMMQRNGNELNYGHMRVAQQILTASKATEIESVGEVVPLGACN
jgi:hypothetical protein